MAVIIDIDHEANDLSEYTSTLTDSGDLSTSAAAALAGTSYGLSALIDDTNEIYGEKTFTAPASVIRWRFYADPNSFTDTSGSCRVCELRAGAGTFVGYVNVRNHAAVPYIVEFYAYNDAASATYVGGALSVSDAPHYIECQIARATGGAANDGTAEMWLDGASQGSIGNLDNFDLFPTMDRFRFGAMAVGGTTAGTVYLDQIVVNDDGSLIGPYAAVGVSLVAYNTLRRYQHLLVR